MSGDETPDSRIGPTGPMYVTDLLDYLKGRNATSFSVALAQIETARRYGPEVAGAVKVDEGLYEVAVHIGYGLNAVFELERDRTGKLQPVLGKIVKR